VSVRGLECAHRRTICASHRRTICVRAHIVRPHCVWVVRLGAFGRLGAQTRIVRLPTLCVWVRAQTHSPWAHSHTGRGQRIVICLYSYGDGYSLVLGQSAVVLSLYMSLYIYIYIYAHVSTVWYQLITRRLCVCVRVCVCMISRSNTV
jgi:hypothetical protein